MELKLRAALTASSFAIVMSQLSSAAWAQAAEPAPTPAKAAIQSLAQAPASAATPASNAGGMQEIIVTAQRRSENLSKVPIAISVVTPDKIQSARITTTIDLEQVVPGLVTSNFANAGIFFLPYIRGVGSAATGVGNSSSVATYIDGVYQPASTGNVADLPDLDHVEVVKGPQGTLFGRNATGGAINVVTKSPSDIFSLTADASYGRFNETVDKFYVTGPIADTLTASLAYEYHGGGNYIHYIPTGGKIGGYNNNSVNAKIRWKPSDRFEATAGFIYRNTKLSDSSQGMAFAPEGGTPVPAQLGFPVNYQVGYSDTSYPNDFRVKVQEYMLHAKYSANGFDVVSITGYMRDTNNIFDDFDSSVANLFYFRETDHIKAFSQELQLVSNTSGPLKWLGGLYYSSDIESYDPLIFGIGVPYPPTPANVANSPGGLREDTFSTSTARSYAAFGQATYEFAPRTNLTLGLRYTSEERALSGEQIIQTPIASGGSYVFQPTVIATAPPDAHKWFKKPTWRVSLDHSFDNLLVYASYNRGFKSGVYNTTNLTQPPVKPEVLDAYEIGAKARLLDNHLTLNAAAFYYNYNNIQVQVTQEGAILLENAAKGRLYGLDLDAVAQPTRDFTLRASVNLLHSEYRNYFNAATYVLIGGAGVSSTIPDATGMQMTYAPKYSFNLGADYKIHLSDSSNILLSGNYYYSGKFYTIIGQGNFIKAYGMLNGTVTWNFDHDRYYVGIYGRNLTNNKDIGRYLNAFGLERQFIRPTTYGVTAGLKIR